MGGGRWRWEVGKKESWAAELALKPKSYISE